MYGVAVQLFECTKNILRAIKLKVETEERHVDVKAHNVTALRRSIL